MAETTDAEKKVDNANTDAANNSDNGADGHSTSDNKAGSVPLATFLDMKKTAKQLEGEIKIMKDAQKAEADAKLIEDGKLQELIDAKTLELSTMQTELQTAKTEAEESKTFKAAKVEEFKKKLGDKWNDEYAKLSLLALDLLVTSMEGKPNIKTDGGVTGEQVDIELTAEQKKDAEMKFPFSSKEKAWEFQKHLLIKNGTIKPEK